VAKCPFGIHSGIDAKFQIGSLLHSLPRLLHFPLPLSLPFPFPSPVKTEVLEPRKKTINKYKKKKRKKKETFLIGSLEHQSHSISKHLKNIIQGPDQLIIYEDPKQPLSFFIMCMCRSKLRKCIDNNW
jgi:hypothetical protein